MPPKSTTTAASSPRSAKQLPVASSPKSKPVSSPSLTTKKSTTSASPTNKRLTQNNKIDQPPPPTSSAATNASSPSKKSSRTASKINTPRATTTTTTNNNQQHHHDNTDEHMEIIETSPDPPEEKTQEQKHSTPTPRKQTPTTKREGTPGKKSGAATPKQHSPTSQKSSNFPTASPSSKQPVKLPPLQSAPCDLLRIPKARKYREVRDFIASHREDTIIHFSAEIDELFVDEDTRSGKSSSVKIPRIIAITDRAIYKFPFSVVLDDEAGGAGGEDYDDDEDDVNASKNGRSRSSAGLTNGSFFSFEERRFLIADLVELVAVDHDSSLQGHGVGGLDVQVYSTNKDNGATTLSFTLNFGELTARRQAFLLNLSVIRPDIAIMQKKKITRITALSLQQNQTSYHHISPSDQQQQLLEEEKRSREISLLDQIRRPPTSASASQWLATDNRQNNNNNQQYSSTGRTTPTRQGASTSNTNNNNGMLSGRGSSRRPPPGGYLKPTQTSIQRRSASPSTTDQLRAMKKQFRQEHQTEALPYHLDPNNYDYEKEKRMEGLMENDENEDAMSPSKNLFEQQKDQIRNLLMANTNISGDLDGFDDGRNTSVNRNEVVASITSPNPRNPLYREPGTTPRNVLNPTNAGHAGNSASPPRTGSIYNDYKYQPDPDRWHERDEIRAMLLQREEQIALDASFRDIDPSPNGVVRFDRSRRKYTQFAKGVQLDFPKQSMERYIPDDPTDAVLLGPSMYPQWRRWKLSGGLLRVLKERKARMMEKAERDRASGAYNNNTSGNNLMTLINGGLSSARSQAIAATTMLQSRATKSRRNSVYDPGNNNSNNNDDGAMTEDNTESDEWTNKFDDEEDFDFCDEEWTLYDSEDMINSLKQHENEMLGKVGTKSLDRLKNMRKLVERERKMFVNSALNQQEARSAQATARSNSQSATVLSSALARSYIPDPSLMNTARSWLGGSSMTGGNNNNHNNSTATPTKVVPFKLSPAPTLHGYVTRHRIEAIDVEEALGKLKGSLSSRNRELHELQKEEYLRQLGREYNNQHYYNTGGGSARKGDGNSTARDLLLSSPRSSSRK